jgi:hypothetical protein
MNKVYILKVGETEMKFSNVNIVSAMDTGMIYPTFNSLENKEIKECGITYYYLCDEVNATLTSV